MTDLYELLNRAIDSQPDTPEARLAVYNHIRSLYERRRQEIDSGLPEAETREEIERLRREHASLETVIARIEAERTGAPVPSEDLLSFDRFAADETVGAAGAANGTDEVDTAAAQAAGADAGRGRPRVAARREPRAGASSRRGATIAAIAIVLAGIGFAAWWLRTGSPPDADKANPAFTGAQVENDNSNKIADRVGGGADETAPQQQAQAAPAPQPAQPAPQPGAAAAPMDNQPEIVAQRAFLFELDDKNPDQPKISSGQVVWRLEGKGSRSAVLYTDIAVPDVGLSFSLVIRPNDDASLPASHTIEVTFVNAADKPERAVRDMAVPQLRVDKEPRGVPLAGLTIPVADNIFLVGLSNAPSDIERNYNLLRERDWVDLPVRFADGGIGTVTFAKGSIGRQVIADAIDSWR